ncbi:MAG: HlyD family efflux transporter periplasmic adaptor subunit [Acidobacteriota bacterium]
MTSLKVIHFALLLILTLAGCDARNSAGSAPKAAPAKVESYRRGEIDLARITLTAEAKARLGIVTAKIAGRSARLFYTVGGEVITPPGQALQVLAPVSGTVVANEPLPPVGGQVRKKQTVLSLKPLVSVSRDVRIAAEAEIKTSSVRLAAAKARTARAAKMLEDRVGSQRAWQDAQEAERLAATALEAAELKLQQMEASPLESDLEIPVASPETGVLRQFLVAPNQMVPGGSPLFEVVRLNPVWLKAPVYSGDIGLLDRQAAAVVTSLGASSGTKGRTAHPVSAPPSADSLASTSHLFYQLSNADLSLLPGERLNIAIPKLGVGRCLAVPWKSVLYDVNGDTWVYEQIAPLAFVRRRIRINRIVEDAACLDGGLEAGTEVVTDGAAELFGTEFGGGK